MGKNSEASTASATKLRIPHITITPAVFEDGDAPDPEVAVSARCEEFPDLEAFADTAHNALETLMMLMEELGWPETPPDRLEAALDYGGPHVTVGERVNGIQTVTQRFRRLGCVVRFGSKWLWFGGSIYGVEKRQRDAIRALVGAYGG